VDRVWLSDTQGCITLVLGSLLALITMLTSYAHIAIAPAQPSPAQLSHALRLADGRQHLLATARAHQVSPPTMDSDFHGLPDVVLIEKGI